MTQTNTKTSPQFNATINGVYILARKPVILVYDDELYEFDDVTAAKEFKRLTVRRLADDGTSMSM